MRVFTKPAEQTDNHTEIERIEVLDQKIRTKRGNFVPGFLFGSFKIDKNTILLALNEGFFSFDLAAVYNTTDIIFDAIKTFLEDSKRQLTRKDFYFCYKLNPDKLSELDIIEHVNQLLVKLSTTFRTNDSYIDMILIHSPNHNIPISKTWTCMQKFVENGKTKEIGVSNFNINHLKCMEDLGLELPALNQVEIHPYLAQKELTQYCLKKGIIISAYRSGGGKSDLLNHEVIRTISHSIQSSPTQLVNSWKFSKGFQIVGISSNKEHLKELKTVVKLTTEKIKILDELDKGEAGRTCMGNWSRFDFASTKWENYPADHSLIMEEQQAPYKKELHEAASKGDLELIKQLLKKDANIKSVDENGNTPFLCAAYHGQLATVQWLVDQKGVSLSEKDKYGHTALLCASYNGQLMVVQWLVDQKHVSLAEKDNNGHTALFVAASKNQLAVVRWLVEQKHVSLTDRDYNGNTALDLAKKKNHHQVVEYLLQMQHNANCVNESQVACKFTP